MPSVPPAQLLSFITFFFVRLNRFNRFDEYGMNSQATPWVKE